VVSSSLYETYGYFFHALGREPLDDPNKFSSYEPGIFWADEFYKYGGYENLKKQYKVNDMLMVPMDSRTTASPTGKDDYVFYRTGGWSWSIPYIAGLYALACQVKPDITPDIFWREALNTSETVIVKNNGKEYSLGKIVNPVKLMDALK
jgi:hypothetical protein